MTLGPASPPDPPGASTTETTCERGSHDGPDLDRFTLVTATTPLPTPHVPIGRIPVLAVQPVIEGGRWPTKAVVGEAVPIRATVFREGHDAVAATAVLVRPDGTVHSWVRMDGPRPGVDIFETRLTPDAEGTWTFRVEGWSDPYGTWSHDAEIKIRSNVDVELMLEEGARLLDRAAEREGLDAGTVQALQDAVWGLRNDSQTPAERFAAGRSAAVQAALAANPIREFVSPSADYPLVVHRERALVGAWYEIFPRSEGAWQDPGTGRWNSGTLRTATERLPQIAAMGFDVIYLTPIHPIGTTFRKGKNNTLTTVEGDPGSPYAIGSPEGGHDAIHPELGTFEDFDYFVARAREVGMEVALDIALQCSPDHPWVQEHPEWFTTRADGSIAYAENPPKKYQDIYPLNFDNDPEGIYEAIRDMLEVWIEHGVTAFRVDNPHTKPLDFWERILTEMHEKHPEVVFLSEAFTRPAMMHTLGMVGFHQSYTYFTWRINKHELGAYFQELAGDWAAVMRPSLWPTTHDILTPYMQQGGTAAFAIRAVLAALGAPTWGIYAGYELVENVPRPGAEEQVDNEKYEFKRREWDRAEHIGIARLLTMLNEMRRAHPALQRLRNVTIHPTSDDSTLCFSRHLEAQDSPTGEADTVIVVVNLDPFTTREGVVYLDRAALGLAAPEPGTYLQFDVRDEITGETYTWGEHPFVRLNPHVQCAHVMSVQAR